MARLLVLLAQTIISAGNGDVGGSTHYNCAAFLYYTYAYRPRVLSKESARNSGKKTVGQIEMYWKQVLPLISLPPVGSSSN